jgi:hypothetical protein
VQLVNSLICYCFINCLKRKFKFLPMKKILLFSKNPTTSLKRIMGILSTTILLGFTGLDLVAQTTLFYKGSGALNDVNSWGINSDGSGGNAAIADFTGNSFSYIIQNTTAIVFNTGTWTVSGTGTKVFMGNPTTPGPAITLTIAPGATINTTGQLFDVPAPGTGTHKIIYQNSTPISVGTVDPNLELVFDGAKFATSTSRTYGNASLINGAEIDFSGATNGPTFNNLTIDEGCMLTGPVGGSNTWIGIKAGGIVTINGHFKAGRSGGLFTANVAFPVVNSTANGVLLFNSPAVTQGENLKLGNNSTIEYYRGISGQTAVQTVQALDYANLIFSNAAVASNKTFATGNITVSGTFTVDLIRSATITTPTTQNITLLPNAKLIIKSATAFPAPTIGKLVLESGPSGTASIGTLGAGASIVGSVTTKQYIPGGSRRYRFLSHPFKVSQSLSQLTGEIDITGNPNGTTGVAGQTTGSGFTSTPTNNPSAYYFSTTDANGDAASDAGWKAFTTASDNNWGSGQGIRALIRGTKGQTGTLDGTEAAPDPVTLEMAGEVNTGNVSIPIVTGGTGATAGYNLIGNPYPSPVDIGAVLTNAGDNVGNAFYLRNPQTGAYITVSPIPSSYMIPAHTAFFVKANAAANLNFTELQKSNCSGCPQVFSFPGGSSFLQLNVLNNGIVFDDVSVNIHSTFENKKDDKDAEKLMNEGINLYTLSADNERLSVNYLNEGIEKIRLGISLPKSLGHQKYQIQVSDGVLADGLKLTLLDNYTNTATRLEKGATFTLSVDPNDNAQTGENRLVLIMSK